MGHLDFGTMQRLNIEAARKHAGQSDLMTPSGPPTGGGGAGGNGGGTPISLNTPDILNSILNINPFFENPSTVSQSSTLGASSTFTSCAESVAGTPDEHEKKVFATLETPVSSTAASSSSLVTNMGVRVSPSTSLPSMSISSPISQTPSVELTKSQLIRDSLKHSIQSKRKSSGKGELDVRAELVVKHRKREELTPEDEERRRRRRERNKIAATKCRNKKKEKTLLLIQESESLEGNNKRLKSDISGLERERQELMNALAAHAPLYCKISSSSSNISSDNRGGTSGGGGNGGGGGDAGTRGLSSSHSMISPQFSTGHHQSVSGCYSTGHHSQFHGGGLPHHHHSTYFSNASVQLS